ncbi:hypothetical protein A2V47_07860 [Candidatus Atribacteria bacterium RBG_19FT_COMBO_35_14]|uniref:Uncharacterized protein n=1 Tax=Candidatus Sediminicultor quintus TaxID=1797291 RepID=A0A1F5ABE4_9BACT|nr:MAG: hypothetical protein A2V47_07860 [Candidatus Atribacteria bacterium RBG_19FT_COMBO_35_14]
MIKLKVDLEMIASAMDDVARVDMDYYLDKETGEVIFLLEEISRYVEEEDENLRKELLDWQKKDIKVAQDILFKNPDRYIYIPEGSPCNGYDLMVEFAETIEDDLLREKLHIALDGKGAFRRFKNVIADYPDYREKWFRFRDERINKKVIEWLNSMGIEPV